jgi:uncharacterized protein (UPF0335 family)
VADLQKLMEQERKTLTEQIEKLENEKAEIDKKIEEVHVSLSRIQAYFDAGKPKKKVQRAPRKSGIRDQLKQIIASSPAGIQRADILKAMDATDDKAQQSVSNALQALKKAKAVISEGGLYKVV